MLEDKPLVSVVITTYKRSPEIVGRALKSVVRQTYSNLEIFVVNDYPDDAEMAEALGKTIKRIAGKRNAHYIVVEHNGGACKARNLALTQAQGKYIACLDDDDEWLPQKCSCRSKSWKRIQRLRLHIAMRSFIMREMSLTGIDFWCLSKREIST